MNRKLVKEKGAIYDSNDKWVSLVFKDGTTGIYKKDLIESLDKEELDKIPKYLRKLIYIVMRYQ